MKTTNMSLRCGLRAVNALLDAAHRPLLEAAQLDDLTTALHERERAICPQGTDTAPHPEGNYPVETLILGLRSAGLRARYVHRRRAHRRVAAGVDRPSRTVGYLVGTGGHYVAVVRDRPGWRLVDNGVTVDRDRGASPKPLLRRLGRPVAAVLRVRWG